MNDERIKELARDVLAPILAEGKYDAKPFDPTRWEALPSMLIEEMAQRIAANMRQAINEALEEAAARVDNTAMVGWECARAIRALKVRA